MKRTAVQSDYTGPTIVHWHGAAPGQALVQIHVGFSGQTQWLEAVTDAQFRVSSTRAVNVLHFAS